MLHKQILIENTSEKCKPVPQLIAPTPRKSGVR